MCQAFESSLARWCWLGVLSEVAVKISAGAAVI